MKNRFLLLLTVVTILLTSCERRRFYVNKPGYNLSYGICEAIDYPSNKLKIKEDSSSTFKVNVMIANLYYGKRYDGSYGLLIGTEECPGYDFETITISLIDVAKDLIKQYDVNVAEYILQENGISNDKRIINKKDFKLIYSFDLIELFQKDYNDKISFKVTYIEKAEPKKYTISRLFSFRLLRKKDYVSLSDFNFSFVS